MTGAFTKIMGRPEYFWSFPVQPMLGRGDEVQIYGKGLGGSSAINAMVYIRGHRSDYDQWASLGNPGWSFSDVLPYFKRSEDNADFDGEYHGKGGPLAVNKLRTDNPVQEIFLQGAREGQFLSLIHISEPTRPY